MMGFDCQDVLTISNALVCVCRKKKKRIIEEGEEYFCIFAADRFVSSRYKCTPWAAWSANKEKRVKI